MCGILGVVSLSGESIDPTALQRMNDRQSHRGPDGEGYLFVSLNPDKSKHTLVRHATQMASANDSQIALGHRRLAILDLSDHGLQPMTVGDSLTWIVFNGEIYNHRELRSELETYGYNFANRTDTEVLLQAYRHWGDGCLEHLDGMFAFAIWDGVRRRVFCARDRFGIKPFYYTLANGYFIFASEIKALLAFPGVEAVTDDQAVLSFLAHGNCDYQERTILQGIKAMPAGQCLTLNAGTANPEVRQYYHLNPQSASHSSDKELIGSLREMLNSTIQRHLISDVRAGSCLSGGLDSSVVVSLIGSICKEYPDAATALGERLQTFTSCYPYPELDERKYALAVATAVGADPQLVFPSAEDFWNDFERLAWHQDMPFGSLSFYAQWRVMRAAQERGVKVLLDGQGGDEVFGGYAKFRYAYLATLLRSGRLPTLMRELAATIEQRDRYVLDLRNGYRYLPGTLRKLFNVDSVLTGTIKADWHGMISDQSTPATRWWRHASGMQGKPDSRNDSRTIMQRIQMDDILIDTLPQLLRFEDRSSMAFSIEARVPLLDHRLVEFGISLPDHLKVRHGWSKFALREAVSGLMPEHVRLRKSKLGFAAPDRLWLSRDLRQRIGEIIEGGLQCHKYVDSGALKRWYNSPQAGSANTSSYLGLFRILSLETWMKVFRVT